MKKLILMTLSLGLLSSCYYYPEDHYGRHNQQPYNNNRGHSRQGNHQNNMHGNNTMYQSR